jgi:hypothetical protein
MFMQPSESSDRSFAKKPPKVDRNDVNAPADVIASHLASTIAVLENYRKNQDPRYEQLLKYVTSGGGRDV